MLQLQSLNSISYFPRAPLKSFESWIHGVYKFLPLLILLIWQVQSNALAALEAICPETAEKVLAEGCVTGDRINGLCDGETGKW